VIGPVSAFFREMAEAWTGWDGAKRWTSLDGELNLSATISKLGQVELTVELVTLTSSMSTRLALEAGSLERVARDVTQVFEPSSIPE
jgi:hypothetical protein